MMDDPVLPEVANERVSQEASERMRTFILVYVAAFSIGGTVAHS